MNSKMQTLQPGRWLFRLLAVAVTCVVAACSSSSQTADRNEAEQDVPESSGVDSTSGGQVEPATEYRLWDATPEVCEEITWVRVVEDTAVFDCDGSELVGFDLASGQVSWEFAVSDLEEDDFSWELIETADGNVGLVVTEWFADEGLSAGETATQFVLLDAVSGDSVAQETVFKGAVYGDDREIYQVSEGVARTAGVFVVSVDPAVGADNPFNSRPDDPPVMSGFDTKQGSKLWTVEDEAIGDGNVMGSIISVGLTSFAGAGSAVITGNYDAKTGELLELGNVEGGFSGYGKAVTRKGGLSSSGGEGYQVINTDTGESFEVVGGLEPESFVDGYLLLSEEESLSFREFNGDVRWKTDEGVVDDFGFHFPGDGIPWIVVTNNAGEEIIIDSVTGEEIPDVSLEAKYYGDWVVTKSKETGFVVSKRD